MRALALVVLLATATASAQPSEPEAFAPQKVELVTMGIGSLMWERHGHIAICVTQEGLRSSLEHRERGDFCYNYGIASFAHPIQMGWGFLRGTHSFWVGKELPELMLEVYQRTDRTIWVQPLPLDPAQTQQVIDKLEDDILEEHRYYAYDHFGDNCTTRIRDIIDNATDHALSKMTESAGERTFRDYARDGFAGMKVPLVITDIILGGTGDRVPTYWERMFLPQYLREAVQQKWGVVPYTVHERTECAGSPDPSCVARGIPTVEDRGSGRWQLALIILVLTAPVWITRLTGKLQRTGLAISILPYWLLGTLVTALAIITPRPYLRWNELVLVWFPLDLAILALAPALKVKYARARVAMLAVIAGLMVIGVFRQPMWVMLMWPLIPMATVAFLDRRTA